MALKRTRARQRGCGIERPPRVHLHKDIFRLCARHTQCAHTLANKNYPAPEDIYIKKTELYNFAAYNQRAKKRESESSENYLRVHLLLERWLGGDVAHAKCANTDPLQLARLALHSLHKGARWTGHSGLRCSLRGSANGKCSIDKADREKTG
jgi:hypothetical protein